MILVLFRISTIQARFPNRPVLTVQKQIYYWTVRAESWKPMWNYFMLRIIAVFLNRRKLELAPV